MNQSRQRNRKKETRGDVMPLLMLVLTLCAISLVHFLPIFGSIFIGYCVTLWHFGIQEKNIELKQGLVKEIEVVEASHKFQENIINLSATESRAIGIQNAECVSHFVFHAVPPQSPTRKHIKITLTPRLAQSPAK
jgi:hypothetical protein